MSRLGALYPHGLYVSVQEIIQQTMIEDDSSRSRLGSIMLDILAAVPLMYRIKRHSADEFKVCPVYLTEEVASHVLQEAWKQCDEEVRIYASRVKKLGHKKCSSRRIEESIQVLDCLTKYADKEEAKRIRVVKDMFDVFFRTKLLDDLYVVSYFKEHFRQPVSQAMLQSTASLLELIKFTNDGCLNKKPDAVVHNHMSVLSFSAKNILKKRLLICNNQQITARIKYLE